MQTQFADSPAGSLVRSLFFGLAIALVVIMWPWTTDPTQHVKILVLHTAAGVCGIATVTGAWRYGCSLDRPALFLAPLGALLGWNILSAALSDYPLYALEETARLISLTMLFFAASQAYRQPKHLDGFLVAVVIGVAISSAYAFFQWAGRDPFPWADTTSEEYRRLPGTFGNPNVAGHGMVVAILASAYLLVKAPRKYAWVLLPLGGFFAHLAYTHHRGGVAALAVAALLSVVMAALARVSLPVRARAVVAIVSTAAIVGGLLLVGMAYATATQGRAVPLDASLLLRFNGFYGAAHMAMDHPLLGAGPNAYVIDTPAYWTDYEKRWFDDMHMMNRHVHNDFLEAAVETGFVGAGLYACFLLTGFVAGIGLSAVASPAARRLGVFYGAFFAAFAVDGLFGFNSRVPVTGFLLFAIAGTLEGLYTRKAARPLSPWPTRIGMTIAAIALIVLSQRMFAAERAQYKAEALIAAKHYGEAAAGYQKAAEYAPWRWRIVRGLGIARYYEKDYDAAIHHLERSIANNPNWVMTLIPLIHSHVSRAAELTKESDADKRREHLERALELAERGRRLSPLTGALPELEGRAAFALAALNRQKSADDTNEWRRANACLTEALDLGVEATPALWNMLAESRLNTGDRAGAESALLRAAEESPGKDAPWAALVSYGSRTGDMTIATTALTEALRVAEERGNVNADAIAKLYLWRGTATAMKPAHANAAAEDFERAIQLAPLNPAGWSRYAAAAAAGSIEGRFREFVMAFPGETLPAVRIVAAYWKGECDARIGAARLLDAMLTQALPPEAATLPEQFGWVADTFSTALRTEDGAWRDEPDALFILGKTYAAMGVLEPSIALFSGAFPRLEGDTQLECFKLWIGALRSLGRETEANALIQDYQGRMRNRAPVPPGGNRRGQ